MPKTIDELLMEDPGNKMLLYFKDYVDNLMNNGYGCK